MNDQSRRTEQSDPRVEAALRDYLERVDRGEPVDREEFLAQHAPIADQLRSFIAAEDEVRKLAAAGRPLERAQDSTKSFVGQGQETIAPHSDSKRVIEPGGSKLSGQFGRYSIIRALGKGAMGTVYLARDTHIERQVALKTPHFTEDPTGEQIRALFPRGSRGRQLAASAHLSDLRLRPDRRETLYFDGLHRGASPLGLHSARQAADRAANPDCDPQAGPSPAGSARPRCRAPRLEAGQHHGRQKGRADHYGLRAGAADPAGRGYPLNADRQYHRDARLHVAGASRRRAGQDRAGVGPIQPRRHSVRTPHGPSAVSRIRDRRVATDPHRESESSQPVASRR